MERILLVDDNGVVRGIAREIIVDAGYEVTDVGSAAEAIACTRNEPYDILITDLERPALKSGDVICLPAAGAYCLAMASNYNGMPRPEVLMVRDGKASVMRRRETLADLVAAEIF